MAIAASADNSFVRPLFLTHSPFHEKYNDVVTKSSDDVNPKNCITDEWQSFTVVAETVASSPLDTVITCILLSCFT